MNLSEKYSNEWDEIRTKGVQKKDINQYLLKFVWRLLNEVKEGKRKSVDLGDGFNMGIVQAEGSGYKLSKEVRGFLMRLSSYGLQEIMGHGDTPHGEVFENPKEVETELKKIAKKLKISLK